MTTTPSTLAERELLTIALERLEPAHLAQLARCALSTAEGVGGQYLEGLREVFLEEVSGPYSDQDADVAIAAQKLRLPSARRTLVASEIPPREIHLWQAFADLRAADIADAASNGHLDLERTAAWTRGAGSATAWAQGCLITIGMRLLDELVDAALAEGGAAEHLAEELGLEPITDADRA